MTKNKSKPPPARSLSIARPQSSPMARMAQSSLISQMTTQSWRFMKSPRQRWPMSSTPMAQVITTRALFYMRYRNTIACLSVVVWQALSPPKSFSNLARALPPKTIKRLRSAYYPLNKHVGRVPNSSVYD